MFFCITIYSSILHHVQENDWKHNKRECCYEMLIKIIMITAMIKNTSNNKQEDLYYTFKKSFIERKYFYFFI